MSELHANFDLIVASSVCAFLPNYVNTLGLLHSLLVLGGYFVQWDWLSTDENSDLGMSVETVSSGFNSVGLEIHSLGEVYSLETKKGTMPVLMGVGRKSHA